MFLEETRLDLGLYEYFPDLCNHYIHLLPHNDDAVDEDEHGNSVTGGEDFSDCDSPQGKGPSPTGAFGSFSPMGQPYSSSSSTDHPNPGTSVFSFPPSSFVDNSNSSSGHSPTLSNSYIHSTEDRVLPLCSAARPLRKRDLLRLLSTIHPSAEVFDSDQVMNFCRN